MKKQFFPVAATALLILAGCNFSGGGSSDTQVSNPGFISQVETEAVLDGNTVRYGSHSYTVVSEIDPATREFKQPTASVTFTNFPASYAEFEAVYNGLLGKSRAGAAAMIPMAIELYARDAETGEKCLKLLCNSDATVSGITRILKTKLVPSEYAPENDSYIQRYMAAALLKGAVNTNAYTPDKPYTVEMTMSPNGVKESELMGGEVTYMYILAHGWDSYQRGVEVFLPFNGEYYKVSNCPSCYTQCKNIRGTWPGLD
ncbi:MAG: hypothetical protein IJV37_01755 [Bacteroidales bacterium]|nr:hypothetical protein [Bacteroidales bacterium]